MENLLPAHADAVTYATGLSDGQAPYEVPISPSPAADDVLVLAEATGLSATRIYQGMIEASQPCPLGWKLHYELMDGGFAPSSAALPEALSDFAIGVRVPSGTRRVLIGEASGNYFDNEGARATNDPASTGGCDFVFDLKRLTCP